MKLQEIELKIADENEDGVFAISLVQNPAIQENWIYLSQEEIELKVIDEEQRIVVGYALIPEKRILRKREDKYFNIFFTAETVKKTAELYMKQLNLNNVTTEHNKKISGASVIESWITEDERYDKVNLYGITPIVGGWAVMMKIYNDDEWNSVKEGKYKGFSIEGKYEGFEELKQNKMDIQEEIKAIISKGLELEKVDVELGSLNELKNIISIMKTDLTNAEKEGQKVIQKANDLEAARKNMIGFRNKLYTNAFSESKVVLDEFIKKAKDLGLDVSNQKELKEIEQLRKEAKQYTDLFDKWSDIIDKVDI